MVQIKKINEYFFRKSVGMLMLCGYILYGQNPIFCNSAQVDISNKVLSNATTTISEELFFDDFGISNLNNGNYGRVASPYVPTTGTNFYKFANSRGAFPHLSNCNGVSVECSEIRIDDNHYAVVSPNYIHNGWFQADSWGRWWKETNDYSGTQNGAALVINAGTNNSVAFYERPASVQVGAKYKASFMLYIVKGQSPTQLALEIREGIVVKETYKTPLYTNDFQEQWIPVSIVFTFEEDDLQNSCITKNIQFILRNEHAAINGNDYYIDNIKLEKIQDARPCITSEGCTNSQLVSVNLNEALESTVFANQEIRWYTTSTPNFTSDLPIADPTNVVTSGSYYAFLYDSSQNCYNTNISTAKVDVVIYPPCVCTKPGNFDQNGKPTQFGISNLTKQNNWPQNIPNGHIALDSKEKGLVISRVQNSALIAEPKKGMLIYDIYDKCVKLYNGEIWKCIERKCNEEPVFNP